MSWGWIVYLVGLIIAFVAHALYHRGRPDPDPRHEAPFEIGVGMVVLWPLTVVGVIGFAIIAFCVVMTWPIRFLWCILADRPTPEIFPA